jgi:hypothetical protein
MNWNDGPLACTLDVGGYLLAECVKQGDGSWTAFDLTGEKGAIKIGNYPDMGKARPAVEKYMEAKI